MNINYEMGDVLQNSKTKRNIIHIVNSKGGFGLGFALAVKKRFPLVEQKYKEWYGNSILNGNGFFKLGDVQTVRLDDDLTFINMLAQNGYKSQSNLCPLDYDALENCLKKVSTVNLKDKFEIWMPNLIGCGLGGGDREQVLRIIERTLETRTVRLFEL